MQNEGIIITGDDQCSIEQHAEECLDYELQAFIRENDGIQYLDHPLVRSIPYLPEMNQQLNKWLIEKKHLLAEAEQERNWEEFLVLVERPYRLQYFSEIGAKLTDQQYWSLLAWVWMDTEFPGGPNFRTWKLRFRSKRPQREWMMDKNEQRVLKQLPEQVTVYRGFGKARFKEGISFTLSKDIADRFAKRFGGDRGGVWERSVNKNNILAYFDRRGEQEVIIL